jgi:hypothetical protein
MNLVFERSKTVRKWGIYVGKRNLHYPLQPEPLSERSKFKSVHLYQLPAFNTVKPIVREAIMTFITLSEHWLILNVA